MSKTVNSNTLLSGNEDSSTDEAQPKCYVMHPQEKTSKWSCFRRSWPCFRQSSSTNPKYKNLNQWMFCKNACKIPWVSSWFSNNYVCFRYPGSSKIQVHDVFDILVLNAHPKIKNTKQNTNNFQHVTTPPLMPKRLQLGVEPREGGGSLAWYITLEWGGQAPPLSVIYQALRHAAHSTTNC